MPETHRGKKAKGKVRKYHLMTFSEDEQSVASNMTETRSLEEVQESVETESDKNDSISEMSIESTNKTIRQRKKYLDKSERDTGDETKKASAKRKNYSKRKNSSLCEQILAAKSNKESVEKLKSDQSDEKQNDGNDDLESENKENKTDAERTIAMKKEKKTSKILKMFTKEAKSEEHVKQNNDIAAKSEESSESEREDGNEEESKETEEQSSSGPVPLEKQVKFCQDRALNVEKSYGAFCQTLSSITRKIARMRDKGDLLSKQVLEYADKEKISVSSSKNLKDFAHNLAAIQDYRDAEIHRLETKVVKPLSSYGPKCKKVKNVIKTEQGAINRELKQRKNLEKIRDKKPGDAHSISAAETELHKARADAAIGSQGLHNQIRVFEKEKLTDLKRILADFVSVEMVFHAKAIEYYSQCFENLAMIDEGLDLEEFSRKLNLTQALGTDTASTSYPPSMAVPQGTITSLGSTVRSSTMETTGTSDYTSTGDSYTYTYGDSTSSSGEKRVRIQTVGQSMYADVDEDDDDEDDDDEYEDDPQPYSRPMRR